MASKNFAKFGIALILLLGGGAFWSLLQERLFKPQIENVLLISIDTLRADYLSSYGFELETTPHIDALAREGVLFKNVVSPVPQTLPAHSSMLTGTIPPYHGMHDNLGYRLAESNVTLAEMLKDEGFTTGAIISSFVLDKKFNLNQGFDTYNDHFEEEHKIFELSERKGDEATRFATAWLEERQNERFFLFLHYYDPHDGYEPPEPFASRFADDLYAGEVAFTDHCIGEVLQKVKELGLFDSTLIVITSDHGEMLGEHGEKTHQYFIYQSALSVPLIFKVPGLTGPKEVDERVGLIDIVPTIAALLGVAVPEPVQGEDLSSWLSGDAVSKPQRQFYAESYTPTRYYGAASLFGLVTDDWKYIQTTRPELYQLKSDPGETMNLIESEPQQAAVFSKRLSQILASESGREELSEKIEVDEDTRRRLESLGYLGGSGGTAAIEGDPDREDPKDLIAFYRAHQQLTELTQQERFDEALPVVEEMLRERPDFVEGHLHMARFATEQNDLERARESFSRAIELDPENERAHFGLANTLRSRGELDEAISYFRRALELEPEFAEAKASLARLLIEQGRSDEAVDYLREALDADPGNAGTLTQLGLTLQSQGKLDEAVDRYRQALRLEPGSAEAHFHLGNTLASQEKFDEAIEHFRQALRARPDMAEVHDRLGSALREEGKTEDALRSYREALRLDPELAAAHNHLGVTLKEQGRVDEAIRHYRRAVSIDPTLAGAHNSLGSLLGSQGKIQEAMQYFRLALEADPDFDEAHNNLGLALRMTSGDRQEALVHFRAAMRQRPDWTVPMNEIAWIVATHPDERARDPVEAVRLAKRAAELTRQQLPVVLDTLAAAYASASDFDSATSTAEKAVALASSAGAKGLADEINSRLELYRQKRPYREPVRTRAAPRP